MTWKAIVVPRNWSGHGEGGTVHTVVIRPDFLTNPYNTTAAELAQLQVLADEINDLKFRMEGLEK